MADPQFNWWRAALQGNFAPLSGDGEEDVKSGYYRTHDGRAVAFWRDNATGALNCLVNGKAYEGAFPGELFVSCSQRPVAFHHYKAFLEKGAWHDQNDGVVNLMRNAPDTETFEGLQAAIDALAMEANLLIRRGAAKTQEEADRAGHVADELGKLVAKADKKREIEKAPHLEACRTVDGKWKPVIEGGSIFKRIKAAVITPFLQAEDRRRREEFQRKQEEARVAREKAEEEERQRQAALEQHEHEQMEALAKGHEPPPPPPELTAAPTVMPEEISEPEFVPASAGAVGGRKIALRTQTRAEIEDWDKAVGFFRDRDEVKQLIQKLADRAVKAGVEVPGVKIVKERVAA